MRAPSGGVVDFFHLRVCATMTTVFVTGPTGCIGAATIAALLDEGADRVIGLCRNQDWSRIDPKYRDRVTLIEGNITNLDRLQRALEEHRPQRIVHLAAFQTPECQAKPLAGMDVNVGGTMNLFRAAAALKGDLVRVVFASSAAVYGPRTLYASPTVPAAAPYLPPNLYGYWKTAGEGMAQAFQRETGISTVCLRLATTYGPGRDKGLTSAPTTAIKSVALGRPYRMPYQGREHYHYVADVGGGFAQAALEPFAEYGVFNLPGQTVEVRHFLEVLAQDAAEQGVLDVDLDIDSQAKPVPFVCDLDDRATCAAFPRLPRTPLSAGIAASLQRFRQLASAGQLTVSDLV